MVAGADGVRAPKLAVGALKTPSAVRTCTARPDKAWPKNSGSKLSNAAADGTSARTSSAPRRISTAVLQSGHDAETASHSRTQRAWKKCEHGPQGFQLLVWR